jgi:hypothetical protein
LKRPLALLPTACFDTDFSRRSGNAKIVLSALVAIQIEFADDGAYRKNRKISFPPDEDGLIRRSFDKPEISLIG